MTPVTISKGTRNPARNGQAGGVRPPPWVDWIHKLGPLIGIIGGLTLFGVTWYLTVDPVYKRALLEERNAKLEIERDGLDTDIKKLEQRQADLRAALKSKGNSPANTVLAGI